jgi:hypothetical protein
METNSNMEKKMCAATAARTGKRCGRKAMPGSDYCATHGRAREKKVDVKKVSPKDDGLCERIEKMSNDPGLLNQIKTAVAAIKALLDEHLKQLDKVRISDAKGAAKEYTAALESHGKRIQSLAGELFEAIDRITKIDERQRKMMAPDEIRSLIMNINQRVKKAVEAGTPGEPPEELLNRLKSAFLEIETEEKDRWE